MGNSCCTIDNLTGNEYLKKLCSVDQITENDPFWNALLGFSLIDLNLVSPSPDSVLLDDVISTFCKNMAVNNVRTRNFQTLIVFFNRRLSEFISSGADDDAWVSNPFAWQVLNSLFIIRVMTKYLVQNMSEEVIVQQFLSSNEQQDDSAISSFMCSIIRGLTQIPIHKTTILLHIEMVNTLLTALALVMYQTDAPENIIFYIEIMQGNASLMCKDLIHYLILTYVHQNLLPCQLYREASSTLTSTLWSVVTLGMGSVSKSEVKITNLGTQCLLLLQVLTNHPDTQNPYRKCFETFGSVASECSFKLDALYSVLCEDTHTEQTTLLLYMLLHQNQVLKQFILSRTDIEKLTEPILRVLYSQDGSNSQQVYLALINLLIMTEDDGYNKDLFQTTLSTVEWYKERSLVDISLGDLFILVIIKSMQFNMAHAKDRFLHTNCLATLANMSSKFADLSTYTCQRIVTFYCSLVKRRSKIVIKLQLSAMKSDEHETSDSEGLTNDLEAVEEMIRMFLEIFNSCFTHAVHHNARLIHVMLCHYSEFEKFRSVETFKYLLQNIFMVLDQFHSKLSTELGSHTSSVADVLHIIDDGLKTFKRGSFMKFPDLKFKYVEESDPGRFFVPYVWHIVCKHSNLSFKSSKFVIR